MDAREIEEYKARAVSGLVSGLLTLDEYYTMLARLDFKEQRI